MSKKNVLVIGGTGFIGYHLCSKLKKEGYQVVSLSRKRPAKNRRVKKVKYIYCDFTNFLKLRKKINKETNYIINLGGNVNHQEKKKTYRSHFLAVKNLVKISKSINIKKFIQVGSSAEYGKSRSPHVEKKKMKKNSIKSVYGISKFMSSEYLLSEYKKNKFPVTILRLYQVYGPRQELNRFIPIVIKSCKKNKAFDCSNCTQKRDFIYIDDLLNVFLKILKRKNLANGEILNVGSGKAVQLKKVINAIKKICKGGLPLYGKIKLRPEEVKIFYPSIKKIQKFLRWRPKVLLNEGLKKTIKEIQ
jgi:nucleoside-diphosphate-sugar epimerase